jgi:hypothetical protein
LNKTLTHETYHFFLIIIRKSNISILNYYRNHVLHYPFDILHGAFYRINYYIPELTQQKSFIMTNQLKNIPEPIIQKMLEHQVMQGNKADRTVFEKNIQAYEDGMDWNTTLEGYIFWHQVLSCKNFELFFERYPKEEKEIIGYNLIDPKNEKVVRAALYYTSKYNPFFVKGHIAGFYPEKCKALGIWDWFEPVYEEVKPKSIIKTMQCDGGTFELIISKESIFYPTEKTSLDLISLKVVEFTLTGNLLGYTKNGNYNDYKVTVNKIDVGCKKNTLVSEWKEVIEIYESFQK